MEILSAASKKSALDPRTKLLLLLFVSVFVLGNAGGDWAGQQKERISAGLALDSGIILLLLLWKAEL